MAILGSRLDPLLERALNSRAGRAAVASPGLRRGLSRARVAHLRAHGAVGRAAPRHRRAAAANPVNPTIGVAMMVQDMAATVAHALCPELLALVDDVVVLDSGSSDGTQDVVRAAGGRVVHAPWPPGGHGEQQTRAAHSSRADWVLVLDGDEVPGEGLLASLHDLVRQRTRTGWWLPRRWVVPWPGAPRWICEPPHWPDYQPRLARRLPELRWTGPVHLTIPAEIRGGWGVAPGAPVVHLDLVVNSREAREEKVRRRAHEPDQRGTELFYLWEDAAVRTCPLAAREVAARRALDALPVGGGAAGRVAT